MPQPERTVSDLGATAEEVSVAFGVHKITVYKWCTAGRIPSVKVQGRRYIPRQYIADTLNDVAG